jgi:glutamine---fructose-6-phosphate transaminase (isomerizing)
MEKEIMEQPITLRKTMYSRIDKDGKVSLMEIKHLKGLIKNGARIVLIACGTSYHACLASRSIIEKYLCVPVSVEFASDFMDRNYFLRPSDICIFVSQSGETADTLYALQYALRHHVFTMAITNKPDSSISRQADIAISLNAGFEMSVASTKAYTSQMLLLLMLVMELTDNQKLVNLQSVPDLIESTLTMVTESVIKNAKYISEFNSVLFVGRGCNYATALESALKVKEIAYIHSEGILAGELKHGPLALIDDRVVSIVFAPKDYLYDKMISVIEQLKARNAKIVVVCNDDDTLIGNIVDETYLIRVPHTDPDIQHIINVIPMQLLAYNLAKMKGYGIDQPRNLAKSVTVSD